MTAPAWTKDRAERVRQRLAATGDFYGVTDQDDKSLEDIARECDEAARDDLAAALAEIERLTSGDNNRTARQVVAAQGAELQRRGEERQLVKRISEMEADIDAAESRGFAAGAQAERVVRTAVVLERDRRIAELEQAMRKASDARTALVARVGELQVELVRLSEVVGQEDADSICRVIGGEDVIAALRDLGLGPDERVLAEVVPPTGDEGGGNPGCTDRGLFRNVQPVGDCSTFVDRLFGVPWMDVACKSCKAFYASRPRDDREVSPPAQDDEN